jgi:hypothetical protein
MVGDRSGSLSLYEEPDLGAMFKKIHEAGFETRGDKLDAPATEAELRGLLAVASGETVVARSRGMFDGRGPRELTSREVASLLGALKEGVTG